MYKKIFTCCRNFISHLGLVYFLYNNGGSSNSMENLNLRYLDMLPTEFGNPLWFTDDELLELKGTTLHRATELQVNCRMFVNVICSHGC